VKIQFCHFCPPLQTYVWPILGHKWRSSQIFVRAKDFCPKTPKLSEKFCATFANRIFPIKNLFWCDLQKKDSSAFLQTLRIIFWSQTTLGTIFARILRNFARISTNQNIWGALQPPAPLHPTPLPVENPLLALVWKKSFRRPCLGVHTHLPKCWRGRWPEKVWETLH